MALPDYSKPGSWYQPYQQGTGYAPGTPSGQGMHPHRQQFTGQFPDSFYRPRYNPMGLPNYGSGHPFFDPTYNYGVQKNPQGTEFYDIQANTNPDAYYTMLLNRAGYGGTTNQDKLARGLYDRFQSGYGAAQLQNPELQWTDYMNQQNIGDVINSLSYQNRGIDIGNYQGRDRWGLRGG